MFIQFLKLFGICSLYSTFLLMPICVFYYLLQFTKYCNERIHKYHKFIVLTSLALPVILTLCLSAALPEPSSKALLLEQVSTPFQMNLLPLYTKVENSFYLDRAYSIHQIAWGVSYYLVDGVTVLISIGFVIFMLKILLQGLYLKRVQGSSRKVKIRADYPIFICADIALPFSVGIFNKRIYLPENMSSKERQIILAHESNHLKQHHYCWSLLESFMAHIFWFNPTSHFFRRRGILLREIECDSDSIEVVDKFIYSRTLVNTAESIMSGKSIGLWVQQWNQKGVLKARLENLLNPEKGKKHHLLSLLFYLLIAGSASGFIFVIHLDGTGLEKKILEQARSEYASISESRQTISSSRIPEHFFQILIFNEDKTFFNHNGISVKAFVRAGINNLSGKPLQGGSTLTQQLGKILTGLPSEKTLVRKLKQVKSAQVLEKYFSKKDILEMYINSVYFGQGAFGIEQAARKFFHHSAAKLTLAESAMLVQSLKKPKEYNYTADSGLALERTEHLLFRIANSGSIDQSTSQDSFIALRERLETGF